MSRFQAEPHGALRPYVHSYWGVARDLSASGGFTVTPDRFLELVFFVDEPPRVEEAGERRRLPVCTLISLLRESLHLWAEGVVRCAAVRFHAWSAGAFFPRADAVGQAWFDLTPAFEDDATAIREAWRRGGWEAVPALLDRAMLRALSRARPAPAASLAAARTFTLLPDEAAARGTGPVAARHGRSRRQIERQVRSLTHRSPKQLASLARFQFVRDTLWTHPATELAALAFAAGYADQAHLTRHFRRYAGQTPGEFLRACARLKATVHQENAADVANLQDRRRGD